MGAGGPASLLCRGAADIEEVRYSLLGAIPRGWQMGTAQLSNYVSSLRLVFSKEGAQSVGGFGTLGSLFPEKWNWYSFWQITAFLSVILAFMNIIPIPALDGGYTLFLLVGRKTPMGAGGPASLLCRGAAAGWGLCRWSFEQESENVVGVGV